MADVHVTTYNELRNAVVNATEATNVYIDNDINVDSEYPTGVSSIQLSSSKTFDVIIWGQNHALRGILCDTNVVLFRGYKNGDTKYWLRFRDISFENLQLNAIGTTSCIFGVMVELLRCKVSCTITSALTSASSSVQFATEDTSIQQSALLITAASNSPVASGGQINLQIGGNYYCDFNNIELQGAFFKIILDGVRNSYIHGDFKCISSANDTFRFMSCTVCILNATIDMTVKMASTSSSTTCFFVNTDNITKNSGSTYPTGFTLCTTSDLQSATTLRQMGFPIRL